MRSYRFFERIVAIAFVCSGLLVFLGCHVAVNVGSADVPPEPEIEEIPPAPRKCKIDFGNFVYPSLFERGASIRLIEGEADPTRNDAGHIERSGYSLVTVYYGDIAGDDASEAVVVLSALTGGSALPHLTSQMPSHG